MALVELRPGDTLNIVWPSIQNTPLGNREFESHFSYAYEDLISKLKNKVKISKSRRSGNEGARFSRNVALTCNALMKGTWSTGSRIDRSMVFEKLMLRFHKLESKEYANITENARKALSTVYKGQGLLKDHQKAELAHILHILDRSCDEASL